MFEMFNYKKGADEFNSIIDAIGVAAKDSYENRREASSPENKRLINESIVKYMVTGTRFESEYEKDGLKVVLNPGLMKSYQVKENFNVVVSQVINAVAPAVSSNTYRNYLADVVQVGWGETARFLVKSNDLFKVNEIAEGVNRGVLQPIYNDEFTVNPSPTEIATAIDWYPVAAGVFDWGDFAIKVGRSFDGYIFLKIIAAMTSASSQMGAAYAAAGIDTTNWTNICDRVSAANGGIPVFGIGTLAVLNRVIPSTVGLQYGLGNEVAKDGFLDRYLGARLLPIDQVMVPGTTNTSATLAVPTNKLFIVSAGMDRPVKVVFEGNNIELVEIPEETSDRRYGFSVKMRIGVAAIVGSKFGTITLA